MRFAVVRHPDVGTGVIPESALTLHRAKGWVRVSDWSDEPSMLRTAEYTDADGDLDAAPAPAPPAAPQDPPQPSKPTRARAADTPKEQ